MKITAIRFILCREALAAPIPLSVGVLTHRAFGIVEVETDAGLTGLGETSVNFPPWCVHERRATIEDGLAPLLLGENPLEIGRLWQLMVDRTRGFTRMWAVGAIRQAISGIDIALWDIAGQHYGVPVSTLLGGGFRTSADCYAVGFPGADPVAAAARAVDAGYRAVKVRIGFDDEADLARVRATRKGLDADIRLMVDANQAYRPPRALAMARRLADLGIDWLEEPVLNDDLAGYARLRAAVPGLRLAWGENAFEPEEVERALTAGVVDVVMPDPCRCGGLTEALRIARMAHERGIPVSPHHYGSDVGFAACLHLIAAVPNFDIMLRDLAPVPLRDEIIETPIVLSEGRAAIPTAPGLGVALDRRRVETSRVAL